MVSFSNDADILKYEPVLFGELHLPGQVLISGLEGILSGTTFTVSGADFEAAQVGAGGVIYLLSASGNLDGAFEIISVNSATELTISVIRSSSDDEPIAPPAATEVSYRVNTYRPQAGEIWYELCEYFGISPGDSASDYESSDILDTEGLKRASVFAVISIVYAILASRAKDENFWKKSLYYRGLFEKARGRCRLCIDSDGDGVADFIKSCGSARLIRD